MLFSRSLTRAVPTLVRAVATAALFNASFAAAPAAAVPNGIRSVALTHPNFFSVANSFADDDLTGGTWVYFYDPLCNCYRRFYVPCIRCGGPSVPYDVKVGDPAIDTFSFANQLIERIDVNTGSVQPIVSAPGTQNIAVDTASANVLAQAQTQLMLFSSSGSPLAQFRLPATPTGVVYDAASKTYAALLADNAIMIFDSGLHPIATWPVPKQTPNARLAADGHGALYVHGDGSTAVFQLKGLGKATPSVRTLLLADPNGPLGIACDGKTIYVDDNGVIASYGFSGKRVKTVLDGLPSTSSFHFTP